LRKDHNAASGTSEALRYALFSCTEGIRSRR
jgi:hypothetical protein